MQSASSSSELKREPYPAFLSHADGLNASQKGVFLWAKHSYYLNKSVQRALNLGNPSSWSMLDVAKFVATIPGCEIKAQIFIQEQIDGETFLMMAQNDLVELMGFKLGPAVKIYNSIVLLRMKWNV
uniref:SAM domain-containing protein n=1 Tax=Timema cristinae TaxID=61476 RepID=A0A7R9CWK2_TIMCR|nr:unnamed protein product [Timema cristinae]